MITDWFFAIPLLRVAEARAASGAGGTWVYRFDHPAPEDNQRLGACHAAEIPFVFGTISRDDVHPLHRPHALPGRRRPGPLAYGSDFITTGDPGWAAYDTTSRTTGLLTDVINATDDPAGDERACWEGIR